MLSHLLKHNSVSVQGRLSSEMNEWVGWLGFFFHPQHQHFSKHRNKQSGAQGPLFLGGTENIAAAEPGRCRVREGFCPASVFNRRHSESSASGVGAGQASLARV